MITITMNEKKSIKVDKVYNKQYEIKHDKMTLLAQEEQLEELCWELLGHFPHLMKDEYKDKLLELQNKIDELQNEKDELEVIVEEGGLK